MEILGLDFETTGLNTETDRVIEVGAVIFDTQRKRPIRIFNEIIWADSYPALTDEISFLTGLTKSDIARFAKPPGEVWARIQAAVKQFPVVMAHNGFGFDFPLLENELKRFAIEVPQFLKVDSTLDIPYPPEITVRKLTYLAAEHGFVNPFAHRAVFDVLTMLKLLDKYDFDAIYKRAQTPAVKVIAKVNYDNKDKAKAFGFYWDKDNKQWFKFMRQMDVDKTRFDFAIETKPIDSN